MAEETDKPAQGLTIYLLKENVANAQAALRHTGSTEHQLRLPGGINAWLYVQRGRAKPPRWARFFDGHVDLDIFGRVASSAAALILHAHDRFFAMTFGQGRYLLDPDIWEQRFGLRVALNSIGDSNIRSIDKRTFDAISRHSKEQASREAAARDFSIDTEQDLLRAITGTPTESELGRRMSGMDALHCATTIDLDSLPELLGQYLDKFSDVSYRTKYPWVDHISEVSNHALIGELDQVIVDRIASNNPDRIWMAVPEVIQWEHVDGFVWQGRNQPKRHDVNLLGFKCSMPADSVASIQTLKTKRVQCLDHEGNALDEWPAYKCIHAEIDHQDSSYLLAGGKWYRLSTSFVEDVNDAYAAIARYNHVFPDYADASEGDYNARLVNTDPAQYALMDQRNIPYGGGHSSVEFCDILVGGRDIVHVKRYGASSVLSHLFSQGLISGELFQTDLRFRELVNERLPDNHRFPNIASRPRQDEYQVVFAVVSDARGELSLPFFSRLNLKHAARRLVGYGYRVSLAKIPMDDTFRALARYD